MRSESFHAIKDRWIKIASAYPYSPAVKTFRGINNTHWIKIERAAYDACIDKRDYRQKKAPPAKP